MVKSVLVMVLREVRCGCSLLEIRRFGQGRDESDWIRVWNAVYGERWDFRPMTLEEMLLLEAGPDFEAEGRFIAELDGSPVGIVFAYVDKLRDEPKGFVRSLGVVSTHRGRGVEVKLADTALKELRRRGMKIAQSVVDDSQKDIIRLWEALGFRKIRIFSLMTMDLAKVQSDIEENKDVIIKPVRKDVDEDLRVVNFLDNECFKEHFDWRPNPVERTMHFVREDPFYRQQEWFFAELGRKHVGYVGIGVDEKYNEERNVKCGWILDIGVLIPHRRTGIGTRLILHGINRLKAMGMKTAMLGVDDWNVTKAMLLYEKVGFKVAKKEFAYERALEE
jgi:ribosomal protein S18 acetylase RimI-like enzyme